MLDRGIACGFDEYRYRSAFLLDGLEILRLETKKLLRNFLVLDTLGVRWMGTSLMFADGLWNAIHDR